MPVIMCAQCGVPLLVDDSDEAKHEESVKLWGKRGDALGMVIVCNACFIEVMSTMPLTKGES